VIEKLQKAWKERVLKQAWWVAAQEGGMGGSKSAQRPEHLQGALLGVLGDAQATESSPAVPGVMCSGLCRVPEAVELMFIVHRARLVDVGSG